jgi:hypothetical protein
MIHRQQHTLSSKETEEQKMTWPSAWCIYKMSGNHAPLFCCAHALSRDSQQHFYMSAYLLTHITTRSETARLPLEGRNLWYNPKQTCKHVNTECQKKSSFTCVASRRSTRFFSLADRDTGMVCTGASNASPLGPRLFSRLRSLDKLPAQPCLWPSSQCRLLADL